MIKQCFMKFYHIFNSFVYNIASQFNNILHRAVHPIQVTIKLTDTLDQISK